jgi:hypothetical protein
LHKEPNGRFPTAATLVTAIHKAVRVEKGVSANSLNLPSTSVPATAVQERSLSHIATRLFADPTTWGTLTLE